MKRIFKYSLGPDYRQVLVLPKDARIISAINQHDTIVIYAVINDQEHNLQRFEFVVQPTGAVFGDVDAFQYIATVPLYDAIEVYNVFYRQACALPEAVVPQNKKEPICSIAREGGTWILEVDNHRIKFKNEIGEAAEYFKQHYQKLGYRIEIHTLLL